MSPKPLFRLFLSTCSGCKDLQYLVWTKRMSYASIRCVVIFQEQKRNSHPSQKSWKCKLDQKYLMPIQTRFSSQPAAYSLSSNQVSHTFSPWGFLRKTQNMPSTAFSLVILKGLSDNATPVWKFSFVPKNRAHLSAFVEIDQTVKLTGLNTFSFLCYLLQIRKWQNYKPLSHLTSNLIWSWPINARQC